MNIQEMLQGITPRPPVPGEVWKFDYLEVHCFLMALNAIKEFVQEDNTTIVRWITTFAPIQQELELKDVKQQYPHGIQVTPLEEDRTFFLALAASQRWHLWCLPKGTELPCGHFAEEHQTILQGWFEREIVEADKFIATRRALENLPPEEKITGKPKLARSDMERLIDEIIETEKEHLLQSDGSLYKDANPHDETEYSDDRFMRELVDVCGHSPEKARNMISKMHKSRLKEKRADLQSIYESKYDILDA